MKQEKYLESKKLSIVFFLFIFLIYSVVYMTKSMFSSAMATIVEEGFMTKSQTGLINAVFWLVYAPFQVIGGFAADKYSPHKLVIIGLLGGIGANIVIYFNQNYVVMMIAWALSAALQFGLWPGVFKIISTEIAPSFRGTAVFWIMFATSVGLGLSMLVASFVNHWKENFLVSVISLTVVGVIFTVLYHITEKKMVIREVQSADKADENGKDKAPVMPLIMSSGLFVFLIICIMRVAVDNGVKMMTPVMLMESYESLPAAIATRISSILIIFSAFGTLIAGFMHSHITRSEVKAQIFLYSVSIIPLIIACFIGKISYWVILIALSIAIMLIHGASPFSQTFVSLRFEKYGRIGTVSGILNATASLGNILASYIFAKMAEFMPWQGVVASWLGAIVLCSLLCIAVLPRWTKFVAK